MGKPITQATWLMKILLTCYDSIKVRSFDLVTHPSF